MAVKSTSPSMDAWLREVKSDSLALEDGMILVHNGVVRKTPKAKVREGIDDGAEVIGMHFSYDREKVDEVVAAGLNMAGITHIRVWMNEGFLEVGDDIMYVLVAGDIRTRVIDALQYVVGRIKTECVVETEKKG